MRRSKLFSAIGLVISITMLFSMLAGCGGNNNTATTAEKSTVPASTTEQTSTQAFSDDKPDWQKDTSEFKFDWYVNLNWWKWNGDYGNDLLSKYIKEKTGATINFITPAGDGAQQLSTMIAADSLPDMVTVESWLDYKTRLAKGGYVLPLNDLMDKYAPNFKKLVYKDVMDWYAEGDGKTYCLPNYAYSKYELKADEKLDPNGDAMLRSDIYEKIGKPDVSSPDKLIAALEKVKNEVKTYNGKTIIPLQLYEFGDRASNSFLWLSQFFSVPFEDQNGNWVYTKTHPKYYEMIKFLNECVRKGLVSMDNFTDKRDQINEKIASGRVFAMVTGSQDFDQPLRTLFKSDGNARYEAFVIKNYEGDEPYLQDLRGFGWLVTMISKNAKQPDRLIRFLEYLNSKEGQFDCAFGKPGVTYNLDDKGIAVWTEEFKQAINDGTATKKYGLDMGQGFNLQTDWLAIRDAYEKPSKPEDVYRDQMKRPLRQFSYDFNAAGGKADPTDPRFDKARETENKIELYYGKQVVKMLLAKSEPECKAIFDETCEKIKAMGFDEWYAFQNDSFQRAKKALGQERSWPGNITK